MSKASEWAKAAALLSNIELCPFGTDAMRPLADEGGPIRIHVSVGRQLEAPVMLWTDHRLGGVILSEAKALLLALWILDTFGDESAIPRPHSSSPGDPEPVGG